MTNKQKLVAAILVGAAAGALVAFLRSEKGKEMMNDLKEATADLEETVSDTISTFSDTVSGFLQKGQKLVDGFESQLNEAL